MGLSGSDAARRPVQHVLVEQPRPFGVAASALNEL